MHAGQARLTVAGYQKNQALLAGERVLSEAQPPKSFGASHGQASLTALPYGKP
jgi:hypothetical protein